MKTDAEVNQQVNPDDLRQTYTNNLIKTDFFSEHCIYIHEANRLIFLKTVYS